MRLETWLGRFGVVTSVLAIVAPPAYAQTITITGVQINQTEAGIEVVLETSDGATPQILTSMVGNTLIFDLENSQLQGEEQSAFSPVEGIAAVTVNSRNTQTVRIAVTGVATIPTGQIVERDRRLVLTITPALETMPPETRPTDAVTDNPPINIIVTATRTEEDPLDVPRSVTVITREQLDAQTSVNRDLGAILSQLVPGLAPTTGSASNFGQSLRGRNITVLIDGVPQSTTRNTFRDLRTIDPSAIERIEVLRGPTAIYGDGATGGVINIITRTPDDTFTATTQAGIGVAPTDWGDSVEGNFQQFISGRSENVDYAVTGSFAWTSGFFDAEGNRIPPDPNSQGGLADADTLNVLGKLGVDLNADQRLQLTVNHYDSTQYTDFTSDPIILSIPGRQRARALEGLQLDHSPTTENTVVSLDYSHDDVFGSDLNAQIYYRDYLARFSPFDARTFDSLGNEIFQSQIESEKVGGRLQIETPLFDGGAARLLWGVDYVDEDTSQPIATFDPDVFDASGGLTYEQDGDRIWTPPLNQRSLGLFAQLNWDISDRFILLGGIRHERIGVSVDGFTTLAGNSINGGDLDYDATLFNLGGVYYLADDLNVFANFSQGFSVADVGLVLRNAPAGFSVEELNPEAQQVDNFELGIRGDWTVVQASLVGFYNESELGTTFTAPGSIVRAPERVYGIEAAIDAQVSDTWLLGGTISWVEGETDLNDDGDFDPLNGYRIAPIRATAYVENETLPGWRNRLQALFSGSRDRFEDETVFGQASVDSYITVDVISSLQLGPGTLEIGIGNLFNTDYFPIVSQLDTSELSNASARGRTVSISYSFSW